MSGQLLVDVDVAGAVVGVRIEASRVVAVVGTDWVEWSGGAPPVFGRRWCGDLVQRGAGGRIDSYDPILSVDAADAVPGRVFGASGCYALAGAAGKDLP